MDFFSVFQIGFDILLLSGVGLLFARSAKKREDDPRLSRGLQILQSKISVLEDLSDRTDQQFRQLTQLLEQKQIDIQNKLNFADAKLAAIDISMEKSLEVAKIFEDRIPHQEIIERQNTVQYVKAARLSHQGMSFEDIAKQVSLPKGELELLVKFNREHLTFSEDHLPEWIKERSTSAMNVAQDSIENSSTQNNFMGTENPTQLSRTFGQPPVIIHSDDESEWEVTGPDFSIKREVSTLPLTAEESLKRLGDQFRQAAENFHSGHEASVGKVNVAVSKVPLTIVRSEKYALIEDIPETSKPNNEAFDRQTSMIELLTLESQNLQKSLNQALEQNKILTQAHESLSFAQAKTQIQSSQLNNHLATKQPASQQPASQQPVHQPSRLWTHLQEHNKSNLAMPPVNESLQPRIFHKVSKTNPANEPIRVQKIQFPRVENY